MSMWEPIRAKKPSRCGYQEQEPGDCHVLYWALCFQKDINQVAKPVVAAGIEPVWWCLPSGQAEHLEASACMVLLSLHHRLAVRWLLLLDPISHFHRWEK